MLNQKSKNQNKKECIIEVGKVELLVHVQTETCTQKVLKNKDKYIPPGKLNRVHYIFYLLGPLPGYIIYLFILYLLYI